MKNFFNATFLLKSDQRRARRRQEAGFVRGPASFVQKAEEGAERISSVGIFLQGVRVTEP